MDNQVGEATLNSVKWLKTYDNTNNENDGNDGVLPAPLEGRSTLYLIYLLFNPRGDKMKGRAANIIISPATTRSHHLLLVLVIVLEAISPNELKTMHYAILVPLLQMSRVVNSKMRVVSISYLILWEGLAVVALRPRRFLLVH